MAIKQLSVFVENKQGKLVDTVRTISEAGINIRAMSIADTKDFGILRLIVSDTDKACGLLSDMSIVTKTDVIAVKMDDKAGALCNILTVLSDAGINVEYMYAFTASAEFGAYVVVRVDDVAGAEKVLADKGLATLSVEDIAKI
ncbi:MAG: ACT domain-containing protein [Clostridia bacterium]|nr:ACT domain-containing protein [Clostridia bacterium]